jgi:methyl-accepting chemotaxis protein
MKSLQSIFRAGIAFIVLLFLGQLTAVYVVDSIVRDDVVKAVRKNTAASKQLTELAILAQQIRRYEKEYFIYINNLERLNRYKGEWSVAAERIQLLISSMSTNSAGLFSASELDEVAKWEAAASFYIAEMRSIFWVASERHLGQAAGAAASGSGVFRALPSGSLSTSTATVATIPLSPSEFNALIAAGKDKFSGVLIIGVSNMLASKSADTLKLAEVASQGFSKFVLTVAGSVVVGVLCALALMIYVPRAVVRPIRQLSQAVDAVSLGKADQQFDFKNTVMEFQDLGKSVERMRMAQRSMLERLRDKPQRS